MQVETKLFHNSATPFFFSLTNDKVAPDTPIKCKFFTINLDCRFDLCRMIALLDLGKPSNIVSVDFEIFYSDNMGFVIRE